MPPYAWRAALSRFSPVTPSKNENPPATSCSSSPTTEAYAEPKPPSATSAAPIPTGAPEAPVDDGEEEPRTFWVGPAGSGVIAFGVLVTDPATGLHHRIDTGPDDFV